MDKSEISIVISLVITAIIVIFISLMAVASNLQIVFNTYIWAILILMSSATRGITVTLVASMVFGSFLGPPVSWGAALLGAFNSDWWLKSYMAWYLAQQIGIIGP